MKTLTVAVFAGTLLFWNQSDAASPNAGRKTQNAAMEFNVRTGEWKPAGPKPVVNTAPLTPEQRKAQRIPWTWRRVAMQPLRLIVMVAKIPMIPAGFVGYNGLVAVANARGIPEPFLDMSSAWDTFDPGPAIDADLERLYPRDRTIGEPAPTPFKSELRMDRTSRPAAGLKSAGISIPSNRQPKAPSTPPAKPQSRPLAEITRPEISDLELLLIVSTPKRAMVANLQFAGPLVNSRDERATFSIHSDLQFFATAPSPIVPSSTLGVVAVNLK